MQRDDIAEQIRARLRTFPDRYAATAPPGLEWKYRRVAENQIAEQLEMDDDELLHWKANAHFTQVIRNN